MDLRQINGVVVDAGHGGDDPGAVSGNLKEKDFNLEAALYMYDRLNQLGIPAVLTRNDDSTLSRNERINNALNAFGEDDNVILVSNHINAGGGEGAEIIYALRNDATLAESMLNNIGDQGQITRKVYQRRLPENPSKDYYYIIRQTNPLQSVLVEYGFIDNPSDATKLQNNLLDYVEGVVKAIADYASVPYTSPNGFPSNNNQYIVQKGDTLYSIAKKLNITVDELKRINNLTSNAISIGQILLIPGINQTIPSTTNTYTVQEGDTLYKISRKFNISIEDLKRLNNLTNDILLIGQKLIIKKQQEMPDNYIIYTVQRGDSLYSIAQKYNVSIDDIRRINNLTNDLLRIGQQLQIPNSVETETYIMYTVESGDTLYSIAKRYNTTVDELKRINNLTSNLLNIGQIISIPTNI